MKNYFDVLLSVFNTNDCKLQYKGNDLLYTDVSYNPDKDCIVIKGDELSDYDSLNSCLKVVVRVNSPLSYVDLNIKI